MPLILIINGAEHRLEMLADNSNLTEVIAALKLKPDRVAVEHNGELAQKRSWDQVHIISGDRIEVVHFVGGGTENCGEARTTQFVYIICVIGRNLRERIRILCVLRASGTA